MPLDSTTYLEPNPLLNDPVYRTLTEAQARIRDPANWCQRAFIIDGRMCAVGALAPYMATPETGHAHLMLARAAKTLGHDCVSLLNDSTDHPTVMRMFDLARARRAKELRDG